MRWNRVVGPADCGALTLPVYVSHISRSILSRAAQQC